MTKQLKKRCLFLEPKEIPGSTMECLGYAEYKTASDDEGGLPAISGRVNGNEDDKFLFRCYSSKTFVFSSRG